MTSKGEHIRGSLEGNVDEALRLFSERDLWHDLNLAETEFVLEEALKCYGSVQDGGLIAELFAFYRRYMGLADVGRRQALLTRLVEFISDGRQNRAMALLCFIASDTDGQIISGAALDLSMILPAERDPLTGPKLVAMHSCGGLRAMTGAAPSDDEGHAAAGLLLLGDARLLPVLGEIWERLSPAARNNMVKRRPNLAYKAIVDFLLARLEQDKDEAHFGELGAFLHAIPGIAEENTNGFILDVRRNFGLPDGREPMELVSRQTVAEVYEEIAPRLRKLIARESSPKVLPSVLECWAESAGLESEAEDDAALGDTDVEMDDEESEGAFSISNELHEEFDKSIAPLLQRRPAGSPVVRWHNPYSDHSKVSSAQLLEDLAAGQVFPLLLTGLFSPLGPTVTTYVVRRSIRDDWSLWSYVLNPFSCTSSKVADLDGDRVSFVTGALDQEASGRQRSLVYKGRQARDGAEVLRRLTGEVLGRSKLQPGFTLCHVSSMLPEKEAFDLVSALFEATKNGSEDIANLRDPAKRLDPWSRLDPVSALQLDRKNIPRGKPVTLAEKLEFTMRVLSPEQRQIELKNILLAWDGSLELAKNTNPALDRDSLVRILLNLTPDMPGLLQMSDQEGGATSPRAASSDSGASAQRGKAGKPPTRVPNSALPGLKYREEPKFTGLTSFIYNIGTYEIWISLGLVIYALSMTDWLLAVCLVVFGFLSAAKAGSMALAVTAARWWGAALYASMAVFVFLRVQLANGLAGMSEASIKLHIGIFAWMCLMLLLHLVCRDFARQVAAAPKSTP